MDGDNPLRAARLERGLSVDAIVAETRLAPHIAQKIDQGRFSELPSGLYARAYIRSFAVVVGLEPEAVLSEVAPHLPGAPDPLPVLRDVVERAERVWPPAVASCMAAALDGTIIGVLVSGAAALIGVCTGVRIAPVDGPGWMGLAVLSAIVSLPYFLILAGVAGRTPGQQLAGVPAQDSCPVNLEEIRRRASAAFMAETTLMRELYGERFCANVTVGSDGW